jgi:sentrin-specific protease 1
VHLGTHWCLGIINLRDKRFEYYDSLHGGNEECLSWMRKWLQLESKDKRKTPFDFSEWKDDPIVNGDKLPVQRNGYDCGVFACMFAEHFAQDVYPDFTQSDMPILRRRMAVEVLTGKLLQ